MGIGPHDDVSRNMEGGLLYNCVLRPPGGGDDQTGNSGYCYPRARAAAVRSCTAGMRLLQSTFVHDEEQV